MEYCTEHRNAEKREQKTGRPKAGRTAPEDLKTRFEDMSGYSFDDVSIHYHSDKPAQMEAAAYTMGNEVYLGAGQEKYLGHELGHVLQQKRKRIPPLLRYKGVAVNNDPALEREADMLARQAMAFRTDVPGSGKGPAAYAPVGGMGVAQMAQWKWNAKTRRWRLISGDSSRGLPRAEGRYDGEIYDDTTSFAVEGRALRPPQKQDAFRFDTAATGDDIQYGEAMEVLRDVVLNGGELDERQKQQMDTYFSNAAFFLRILQGMRTRPEEVPQWDAWQAALAEFEANVCGSVFTRDIDGGELAGQPVSGGTMSVVERMKRGLGRIRNYKDLNRGGGAGSYVRFVAWNKRPVEGEGPSNPLNVGSLASAGITVLYDAASVVKDNSAPAHLAFNKQDSAGRIFETDIPVLDVQIQDQRRQRQIRREVGRKSGLSAEILKRGNPDNQVPFTVRDDVPELTEEYIMGNAIRGLAEMTRQASQGQSAREEYNETILFSGAKISNIKAVLIHRPLAPDGGVPVKKEFTKEQKQRQQRRREWILRMREDERLAVRMQIGEIDREVKRLREHREPGSTERIIGLEGEKTALLRHDEEVRRKKIPEVRDFVFQPGRKVSTDLSVRSPFLFEKGQLPPLLGKWYDEKGYGGVPMKYLFYHVNPGSVKREDLPRLADAVWARGYAAWQDDIDREERRKILEAHAGEDAASLQIRGISLASVPAPARSPQAVRSPLTGTFTGPQKSRGHSSVPNSGFGTGVGDWWALNVNNCLITAITRAALNREPTEREIRTIREGLLGFGYQYGEMLYASERVIRLIMGVLGIQRPVIVHYEMIGDEHFMGGGGQPVEIYHRGLHFSHERP